MPLVIIPLRALNISIMITLGGIEQSARNVKMVQILTNKR